MPHRIHDELALHGPGRLHVAWIFFQTTESAGSSSRRVGPATFGPSRLTVSERRPQMRLVVGRLRYLGTSRSRCR